jgi:WD40 repeat protein
VAAQAETLASLGNHGEAIDTAISAFSIAKTSQAREAIAHVFPNILETLEGHSDSVRTAAFSPDGQRVVTASADYTARVWNAATGQVWNPFEQLNFAPPVHPGILSSGVSQGWAKLKAQSGPN